MLKGAIRRLSMRYSYTKDGTALLFVDPYNDFLWPYVREVAEEVGLLDNLRAITAAIRKAGIRIFIVPHHRALSTDFAGWKHPTP
jgi:nicotinamidase-related amidase